MTTTIIATAKTYNKIKIHWYIYLRGYHWSNVLCKTIVQGIAEDYIVNISQRPRHCLYCPRQSLLDCLLSCLPALEPPWLFKMLLELIIWGAKNCHDIWRTHLWSGWSPCILSSPGRTSCQQEAALAALSPVVTPSHIWRTHPVPVFTDTESKPMSREVEMLLWTWVVWGTFRRKFQEVPSILFR